MRIDANKLLEVLRTHKAKCAAASKDVNTPGDQIIAFAATATAIGSFITAIEAAIIEDEA